MRTLFILCIFAALIACDDDSLTIEEINEMEINEYLESNGLNAESTSSGLHYIVETQGNGEFPTLADTVTVHYRGYYTDGQQFDSSYDRGMPATFPLSGVIQGWQEGIPFISKGGSGKLIIPSTLGYGSFPPPGIRPDAVLVFDVEVINF